MSDSFKIHSSSGDYTVRIGTDVLGDTLGDAATQIILCDRYFAAGYQARGLKVIAIDAHETSKSLERIGEVIVAMRELGANRKSTVLAIGGGVIQDIATFVASLYMRGLSWAYLPTTLLGMVDSCIGGKSSINVGHYKNLIGNFYPPQRILIDLQFVDTLNTEQRVAGLCEAVKICFAHTGPAFDEYLATGIRADSPPALFQQVITLSLLTKRWFIEIDEHDQRERLLLNFGHTFGHAIEGAAHFAIPHGIAVGMGMLAALRCAELTGQFSSPPKRVVQLAEYTRALLATVADLTSEIATEELFDRFSADKKHGADHYAVIVPDANGHLIRLELPKTEASRALLMDAFHSVCRPA